MAPMLPLWPCSSTSNDGLVQNLQKVGIVRSAAVFDAMKRTDRALFVPRAIQDEAYQDSPCPIGFNQIISAPHMHAQVLELAHASCTDILKPRVLDVGAGSGYLTAALARLVEDAGGRPPNLLKTGVLSLHCYNGWYGLPAEAPFHFIFVGAAVSSPPQAMLDQLADGGQLVIPVDDPRGGQALVSVTRRGSCLLHRKLMPACFVPLVRGEIYKNRRGVTSTDSELQQ
ncbi:protein-L-isoaspartate O-methyltransferase [Phytophthora nicotianae]|uniref:protein-L-isoaspartate(D-aspartate) O-methyltransferase n=1 Tax=Phytophthora nicotianae TaxID=4792 RepID=W2GNZ9_PHYNI|nr:protein-L-isoaspartate O-methyltransferase [Phytophthora nicotianae]